MVHLCIMMISAGVFFIFLFFFFQNFDSLGCLGGLGGGGGTKGQKMVKIQNEKEICLSCSISQESYII